jgi:predicted methyltransferase
MQRKSHLLVPMAASLLFAIAAPALAAPADLTAAVASKSRAADNLKLDESRHPVEVLKFLGLKKGDRALDIMPGAGYYTEIMAAAVGPKGVVIAAEPPQFLDKEGEAKWQTLLASYPNARLQKQQPKDLALAPASVDFTLMHLVYHDLYWESTKYNFPKHDPDAVLANLFRATKPGGIVGVVDHVGPAGDTRAVVDKTHRIDPTVIRADFERAGFRYDGSLDVLRTSSDDTARNVFNPAVRGKTDRVVYRFRKPADEPTLTACDAAKVQNLIGQTFSDAVRKSAQSASGARTVRSYKTGSPVTMDYSPERLNIETGADGKIVALTCG